MSRFKRTFEIAPKADKKYEVRKILKAQKYVLSLMEQLETFQQPSLNDWLEVGPPIHIAFWYILLQNVDEFYCCLW